MTFAAIAGDSVSGDDRELRQWLEARHQPSVVALSSTEHRWLVHESWSLADLSARLTTRPWERLSCGAGSQGPRWYDWQRVRLNDPAAPGRRRWLVLRRSCTDPTKVRAYGPEATPLDTQVRVIGKRWTVEERIQTGKSEVRSWTGWYRHSTLAMWAHAVLRVLRHQEGAVEAPKQGGLQSAGARSLARFKARQTAVRVSSGEGRQLFWNVALAVDQPCAHILHWSWWRRCHQALAQAAHCRRRARQLPPVVMAAADGLNLPAPVVIAPPNGEPPAVEGATPPVKPPVRRPSRRFGHA